MTTKWIVDAHLPGSPDVFLPVSPLREGIDHGLEARKAESLTLLAVAEPDVIPPDKSVAFDDRKVTAMGHAEDMFAL